MSLFSWKTAADGSFTVGANWDKGTVPGPGDEAAIGIAGSYTVNLTASITVGAITLSDSNARFVLHNPGGSDAVSGDFTDNGWVIVDDYGQGGSSLSIGGTLTNTDQFSVGNGQLAANTTVTAGSLNNTGTLALNGNGTNQAAFVLTTAAPSTWTGIGALHDNALLEFASGSIGAIGTNAQLNLYGVKARVATAADPTTNSALAGLTSVAGQLLVDGDTLSITGPLTNSDNLLLDDYGWGGGGINIAGTLTNQRYVRVGAGALSASAAITVGDLANSGGTIDLNGNGAAQAALIDTAAAPSTWTGTVNLQGNSLLQFASGGITAIGANSAINIYGSAAHVADAGATSTDSALTGLNNIAGQLLVDGDTLSITGPLTNSGNLLLDDYGWGGGGINIAGTLTNQHYVRVGAGALSASAAITVGDLANSGGTIDLNGNGAAQAALIDTAAAPSTWTGTVNLQGNSLLQFASGGITAIGANSAINIYGSAAHVADAGATSTDSALTGLNNIAGQLLMDGDTLSITGPLTNSGNLLLDDYGWGGGGINIAGTLTNQHYVRVGAGALSASAAITVGDLANSGGTIDLNGNGAAQAALIDTAAAPSTWTGTVNLQGNSLLQFASGGITAIGANSAINIYGSAAHVADAGATSTDSALTGLNNIAGQLLMDGDTLSITGPLTNSDNLLLDDYGWGGGGINIAGTLTNQHYVRVGAGALSASAAITVGDLANSGGTIDLNGNGAAQAALIDTAAAPSTWTGTVNLQGNSLLQFASGGITAIGANSAINIYGSAAHVADAGATSTDSALTGLTSIAGQLLDDGATVSITGPLTNSGNLLLDDYGWGGGALSVTGTVTNQNYIRIGAGNLTASATMTLGGLANTGSIDLFGTDPNIAGLQVNGNASNANNVNVAASGALGVTGLYTQTAGNTNVVGTFSAGSVSIQGGSLNMQGGQVQAASFSLSGGQLFANDAIALAASAATLGAATDDGALVISGGTLSLAGGTIQVGSTRIASSFTLAGNGTVNGTLNNGGTVDASGGTLDLTGTVEGAGKIKVESGATLELGANNNARVDFNGTSATFQLDSPGSYFGVIGNFAVGDTLELIGKNVASVTPINYSAGDDTTTLDVNLVGGQILTYALAGNYIGATFQPHQVGSNNSITLGALPNAAPALTLPTSALVQQGHATSVAGISVSDADAVSANETLTVTVTATGTLTANTSAPGGGGTITGSGSSSLLIVGTLAQVNADLGTLALADATTAPDTIQVSVNDGRGASAGPQSVPVSVNAQPTVSVPANATVPQGIATTISGVSVADADSAGETLTATLSTAHGKLHVTAPAPGGATVTGQGTIQLTVAGTLAQVNAELATLTDSETAGADTIAITAGDGRGGQGSGSIPVAVQGNAAPVLTVPGAQSAPAGATIAVTGISVADADAVSGGETITVVLTDGQGALAADASAPGGGGTITGAGTHQLTIAGTLAQVNADLASLHYGAGGPGPDTIDVAVNDGRGGSDDQQIGVTVAADAPPVLSAPGALVSTVGVAAKLLGVSVADADAVAAGQTITVTLDDKAGRLIATANAPGGGGTITGAGSGHLVVSGTLGQVNADLSTLTYQADQVGTDLIDIRTTDGQLSGNAKQLRVETSNPAEFAISPSFGTLSRSGTNYTLDLGTIASGAPVPTLTIGIINAMLDPAATLSGTVSNAGGGGLGPGGFGYLYAFAVSGTGPFSGVASGSEYTAVKLVANTANPGYFTDTITLDPVSTPGSGLGLAPETLTIDMLVAQSGLTLSPGDKETETAGGKDSGTIILPDGTIIFPDGVSDPIILPDGTVYFPDGTGDVFIPGYGDVHFGDQGGNNGGSGGNNGGGGGQGDEDGDVHMLTFDGLYYDFQAVGEFVSARSTAAGDTFEVQIRTRPYHNGSSASVISQAAARVGTHRVTVDLDRTAPLFVDGIAVNLTSASPKLDLGAGHVTLVAPGIYRVVWNTGEAATFAISDAFINVTVDTGTKAAPGSFVGLLGPNDGNAATDLRLTDGTVIGTTPSFDTLYGAFADSWRVTQQAGQPNTSILDYGPGETTATFTDKTFPQNNLKLSDLPANVVARATALVDAAGISDPGLRQAAIYDYAVTGDTSFVTAEQTAQQTGATTAQQADVTGGPNPTAIGVSALAAKVLESNSSATTPVVFQIYRTGNTSGAVTVDYQVVAAGPGYANAATFGGTLPSGQVVIPDGQSSTQITIQLPVGFAGPDEKVQVQVTGENGVPAIAPTAETTVTNNQPVAGTPSVPSFELLAGAGSLTHTGNAWTLDLGQVTQGTTLQIPLLAVLNTATQPADLLSGHFDVSGDGVITVSGAHAFADIAPGAVFGGITVAVNTLTTGQHSTTLTFHGVDSNDSGYSATLPDTTLTIVENGQPAPQPLTFAQAVPVVRSGTAVTLGATHVRAADTVPVRIDNGASYPGESLDATIGATTGAGLGSGSITRLAAGATDGTDIAVGVDASTAGAKTGTVTLNFSSDGQGTSGNGVTPLTGQVIHVSGSVYRLAAASVSPLATTVHVHDPGTLGLTVANTDPADAYSETLLAQLGGATGTIGLTASGSTGPLAAGSSSTALSLGFSTASAGTGSASVALTSDGTGIDELGQTALAAKTVTVTVDNYANPAFEQVSGPGTLTRNGNQFTLDLGTIAQGSGFLSVGLGVLNQVTGPADLLSGSFASSGSSAFTNQGLAAFTGTGAGQADTAPIVKLDTTSTGQFSETITLNPTGSNASGYTAALAPETLTITGNVAALPSPALNAPDSENVVASMPTLVSPLTVTDANLDPGTVTVTLTANSGTLGAKRSGNGTVTQNGPTGLVLTGTLAEINAELASVTYDSAQPGSDTIAIVVTDAHGASVRRSVAITVQPLSTDMKPVLHAPTQVPLLSNTPTGIGGISVSDPAAQAAGTPIQLEVKSSNALLTIDGPAGPTITGQGTHDLVITGTVDQINADFSDGIKAVLAAAIVGLYAFASIELGAAAIIASTAGTPESEAAVVEILEMQEKITEIVEKVGETYAKASEIEEGVDVAVESRIALDIGDAHITTFSGQTYNFNASGEFVLAKATNPGDTFQIQARLQPYGTSQAATVITQIAALLGTDRVTIGLGRANTVLINGSAVTLTVGTAVHLSGGTLTEAAAGVYAFSWNTGESLTVVDNGTYLDLRAALGAGQGAGSVEGLMGPAHGKAADFTLPNGTVLSQPLSADQLYNVFGKAWEVTSADSLLDYGAGQSPSSFPLTPPAVTLTLDDLPADIVANAKALVNGAGITDPVAVANAAFDYLATGDTKFIGTDGAAMQGLLLSSASPTETPTTAVGVTAASAEAAITGANSTLVDFDVYLTAALATNTTVNYTVVAPDAADLGADAFGGTLPSGSVTVLAGQKTAQFAIEVPNGTLGSASSRNLVVQISDPGGPTVFAAQAQTVLTQPATGAPPAPTLQYLGTIGTFDHNGNNYTLDLGGVQVGTVLPKLQFAIKNAATGVADQLSGTFDVVPVTGFAVSGASLPDPLGAGQVYGGLVVTANEDKFGANGETITFHPTDVKPDGTSTAMAPITLTIADTLEVPSMIYSEAWGDVHIITYNQLHYDFQAAGEFVLAESRIPGDNFAIQMRLEPWNAGASVTVIRQVAIQLGADKVTFDWSRDEPVWVDGSAGTIDPAHPITLVGGTVTEVSADMFRVQWNTGETMTVTHFGNQNGYINIIDGIPGNTPPGAYGGLQGEDEGQANDFQLPDGTILPQPLTTSTLYGLYANSWRVSQPSSLFDYPAGKTTADFTDVNFPADVVTLANLPATAVSNAAALVAKAGITDQGIAQDAELDFLATGDPTFIQGAQSIQESVFKTTPAAVTTTQTSPALGVAADASTVAENAAGTTPVSFDVYLTQPAATDTTVDYAVTAPAAGFLGAAAFGGTLPSGQVVIAAGNTSATVTIDVPQGALGTDPSENVQLTVSSPAGLHLFAPTAQTEITNPQPEPGSPALPQIVEISGGGTLSFDTGTNTYTLDLGSLPEGAPSRLVQLGILNAASAPADSLSGSFTAPLGTGFTVTGNQLLYTIAAGQSYQGLYYAAQTDTPGQQAMTLTFTPQDVNDSGYAGTLPTITLKVEDTVSPPAQAELNTPSTIVFPNVRVGTPEGQAISVSNTATPPAASLDVTTSVNGDATATGSITQLAAGSTDFSSIAVGLKTESPGAHSGAVTLQPTSDAGGGNTRAIITDPEPTIDVFGSAYRLAAPQITPIGKTVHVGDAGTAALTVANTDPADGFSEALIASLASATGGITVGASGPTADIAANHSDSTLAVGFSTAAAATINGSVAVNLTSDGGTGAGSIDGLGQFALDPQTVGVQVTVDNYANPVFEKLSGAGSLTQNGNAFTLDLGTLQQESGPLSIGLGLLNDATGPTDLLSGTFSVSGSSAFGNAGLNAATGLGAGSADTAPTVTLDTSSGGHFAETITFHGTGSNASGYSGALADRTLTIEGDVGGSTGGQSYVLTRSPDQVAGSAGDDTITATSRTPSTGDQIDGGGGSNTLALTGPGTFDLRAPTTLTNVQTITAQEGQPANALGDQTFSAQNQIIVLRDGLDATVQVSPAATVDARNPKPPTLTIVAGQNADVINLASGDDVVTLGDRRQTLSGGSGNDTIIVNAASIGATIDGGTGHSMLDVTGGGTAVMGSNISNIAAVQLSPSTKPYDFQANATMGLTVTDTSTGADTLRAGAIFQTLDGGGAGTTMIGSADGNDTFAGTAAQLNGDTIENFSAPGTVIDLTDVKFATLHKPSFVSGALAVTDGTHAASIKLPGVSDTALFQATDDGNGGTKIVDPAPADIAFTDVRVNMAGDGQSTDYTGPVTYLQHQFVWSSSDPAAVRSDLPNSFLKGGPEADALQVTSGDNVLDGGAGSNFLVGGSGADGGFDTFFVNGLEGVVTWSTIVNFHPGDMATIFGFHGGLSTMTTAASEGAKGHEGWTIHSALSGPGTTVDASMTFAGIDAATAANHFSITSGTLGSGGSNPIDYLLIQYNR